MNELWTTLAHVPPPSVIYCVYYIMLESPILTMVLFPAFPIGTKKSDFNMPHFGRHPYT
jgi:hypothetical protein